MSTFFRIKTNNNISFKLGPKFALRYKWRCCGCMRLPICISGYGICILYILNICELRMVDCSDSSTGTFERYRGIDPIYEVCRHAWRSGLIPFFDKRILALISNTLPLNRLQRDNSRYCVLNSASPRIWTRMTHLSCIKIFFCHISGGQYPYHFLETNVMLWRSVWIQKWLPIRYASVGWMRILNDRVLNRLISRTQLNIGRILESFSNTKSGRSNKSVLLLINLEAFESQCTLKSGTHRADTLYFSFFCFFYDIGKITQFSQCTVYSMPFKMALADITSLFVFLRIDFVAS